jgi:hypothetical protein
MSRKIEFQDYSRIIDFALMKGKINPPYVMVPHRVEAFLILSIYIVVARFWAAERSMSMGSIYNSSANGIHVIYGHSQ